MLAKLILSFGFSISFSDAAEPLRPQTIHDYTAANIPLTIETAIPVEGARVVWADFDLLKKDFYHLNRLTNEQISAWLLRNFAYVGAEQSRLSGLRNSEFKQANLSLKNAYRPSEWVRSAVVEAMSPDEKSVIGVVDIKGFGYGARYTDRVDSQVSNFKNAGTDHDQLNSLRTKDHSDGLASLGEVIAETSRQRTAQMLFDLNDTKLETVENYAIIQLPINILKKDGHSIPAGMVLRQGHFGREHHLGVPENIYVDNHGGRQHTSTNAAIDFGGVIITDKRVERNFRPTSAAHDPQFSLPWQYGHETADAVVYKNDIFAIYRHLDEMTKDIQDDYKNSENVKKAKKRREEVARKVKIWRERGLSPAEIIQKLVATSVDSQAPISNDIIRKNILDGDAAARTTALEMLGRVTDKKYVYDTYAMAIKHKKSDPTALTAILQNLYWHHIRDGVRDVADLIGDELIEVFRTDLELPLKTLVINVLGRTFDSAQIPKVSKLFQSFSDADFKILVSSFNHHSHEIAPELIELAIRRGHGEAVYKIAQVKNEAEMERLIDFVLNLKNSELERKLMEVVGNLPFAKIQKFLTTSLKSDDLVSRNYVLKSLGQFNLAEREALLLPLLTKSAPFFQTKSARIETEKFWFEMLQQLKDSNDQKLLAVLEKKLKAKPLIALDKILNALQGRTDNASVNFIFSIIGNPEHKDLLEKSFETLSGNKSPLVFQNARNLVLNQAALKVDNLVVSSALKLLQYIPGSLTSAEILKLIDTDKDPSNLEVYMNILTADTKPENIQMAREILKRGVSKDYMIHESILLDYLTEHGEEKDLQVFNDPRIQDHYQYHIVSRLQKRKKDNAAIPYIIKAIALGESIHLNELRKILDVAEEKDVRTLQSAPKLNPELAFVLYEYFHPPKIATLCRRLFR